MIEYKSVLLILLLIFGGCASDMNANNEWNKLEKSYAKDGVEMKVRHTKLEHKTINYLSVKGENNPSTTIVFIHGAPGRADNFGSYLKNKTLLEKANVLSVERLGYGSEKGNEENAIGLHGKAVRSVLNDWEKVMGKPQHYILVGHSYGGPIAAYTSVQDSSAIAQVILLAPAMSSELELMKWYSRWAQSKMIYAILPSGLKVATDEKANHAESLKKIEGDWNKVKVPTTIVHGTEDGLVPFENLQYVVDNWSIDVDTLVLEKKGHLFPFKDEEIVVNLLLRKIGS
ncbi:alpha/beta fold hydrolase [Flammeovirga sp. OC4]|uniref:alpha/beta fold hydrolase n=1 Tax=Flammeovirga sp. OC4 TaxID=1382345 RepID=UPI0009E2C337|nr:alpha/beta hydrolase [Flammeovirga sp. OC4]